MKTGFFSIFGIIVIFAVFFVPVHGFSEDDFDTGRFSYFHYGEKFYQYKYHPFGTLASESFSRCYFTSDFVLDGNSFPESGYVSYKFPNDMVWPGGYANSTFFVISSPSFNFPEDNDFERIIPTKTEDDSIVLEFDLVPGLNTFLANSTAFWDSQRSQMIDCPNPLGFEKQEHEYYDFVYPLKVQQNYAKMLGLAENDFLCKTGLIPVLRHDSSAACVKQETYFELIKRGWVSDIIRMVQSRDVFLDPKDATSSYMEKIIPTLDDFKNVLLESHDIDAIFSKFGEPHDDIGSGIHIYVYELDDSTKIWIGYADDVWYVKHVDANGNALEDLFVK